MIQTQAARNTDPVTSHEAAESITKSGLRKSQQKAVLKAVQTHPGCTARELADKCDIDRYTVSRRLPELETAGLVEKGKIVKCRVGGRSSLTWWSV